MAEGNHVKIVEAAVRSMGFANAALWLVVSQLLEDKGVASKKEFADLVEGVAGIMGAQPTIASDPDLHRLGVEMLELVYTQLRGKNPPAKWKPTIVE